MYALHEKLNGHWTELDSKIPARFESYADSVHALAALTFDPESPYYKMTLLIAPVEEK